MNNKNLDIMEKNLRSMAKRYENVKYSLGLAILFLMKGTSAFSDDNKIQEAERKKDILTDVKKEKSEIKEKEAVKQANQKLKASWTNVQFGSNDMYSNYFSAPKAKVEKENLVKSAKTVLVASADNSTSLPTFVKLQSDIEEPQDLTTKINASKENIKSSVGSLQDKIANAKRENDKELEGLRLELIQLMEQGDQVVKSPWSSWQFGANYMNDSWSSAYKGRGDKKEKYPFEGIFTRSSDLFLRNVSPESDLYEKYVLTNGDSALNSALTSTLKLRGRDTSYGLASTNNAQEPIVTVEINASVKPKTVQKNPISLNIPEVNAPAIPNPNISEATPPNIELPEPKTPTKEVSIPKVNASPFTGYYFDGTTSHAVFQDNISVYSGIDPNSLKGNINNTNPTPAAMVGTYNGREFDGSLIDNKNDRFTNLHYVRNQEDATKLTRNTYYLRGHYTTDTYDDSNTRAHSGESNSGIRAYKDANGKGIPDEGVVGIHALGDLKFKNLKFNLYGRAGAMTNETWRHGILNLENVEVNMYNSDNMGFYNMPVARYTYRYAKEIDGVRRGWLVTAGGFSGKANINMYGRNNSAYLTTGFSYMKHWQNEGKIQSEGASNIVFSSFSYSPTLSNLENPSSSAYLKNTNMVKLANVNLYGDENIGMYFGSRIKGNIAKVHMEGADEIEGLYGFNNKAAHIGLYQGEIDFTARIGEKLSINNGNKQTTEGNLSNAGYTDGTVDASVGIFSESGQRVGIAPRGDIMEEAPPRQEDVMADKVKYKKWLNWKWDPYAKTLTFDDTKVGKAYQHALAFNYSKDPIHNLEVAKLDIRFGKYSKNGIMVLAKSGTVIDVGKNSSNFHVKGVSTDITDGINGENTTEADASTGTIVAYAEGTWDQLKHRYGNDDARIAKNDADATAINNGGTRAKIDDATATTAARLQGLGSEINVYSNVVLASKEGIAYREIIRV